MRAGVKRGERGGDAANGTGQMPLAKFIDSEVKKSI